MKLTKSITTIAILSLSSSSITTAAIENENFDNNADSFVSFLKTKQHDDIPKEVKSMVPTLTKLRDEFVQWVDKFERVYESFEEELERMLIWAENHEFIQTHNQKYPKPSYTVAHNNFSDMTNDEFQKRHSLGKYSPGVDVILTAHLQAKEEAAMRKINGLANEHPLQAEFRYLRDLALPKTRKLTEDGGLTGFFDDKWWNDDGTDEADDDNQQTDDGPIPDDNDTNGLPDEVDWVKAGAVTPAKNQGACGSCWAFSTTGSIEGAMFVKHGQLIPLSEQNLIDCDHTDKGCEGGMMEDAFKFDESAHGLCSETDYPYIAKDDEMCMTNCTKVPGSVVTDYLDIDEKDKHGLLASLALQPTSIAMQADQLSFQFYSSGVFSEEDCGETGAIDHGVLAVGYGTDEETGKKYFTVKNSWGPDWGENGFFRLARQSKNEWGTCAILRVMTAPIVA